MTTLKQDHGWPSRPITAPYGKKEPHHQHLLAHTLPGDTYITSVAFTSHPHCSRDKAKLQGLETGIVSQASRHAPRRDGLERGLWRQ